MAKIIGYYFDGDEYNTFTIDGLRETGSLYIRTAETVSNASVGLDLDNWKALNKCHLGRLRPIGDGIFTMYCLQEDLSRFKEKVSASLSFRRTIRMTEPLVKRGT